MIFNSPSYVIFFAAIALATWLNMPWWVRKVVLIAFSYAFYAAWYPPTIVLLWASTLCDWFVTQQLVRTESRRARVALVAGSLVLNLALLGYFKYATFFAHNANLALVALGTSFQLAVPHPLLPVGISFYTFMSLSYVIDVYRGHMRPTKSFLSFALFLTFYPHLVAGPIVRGHDFLPQCESERRPTRQEFVWGICLLLFGVFQKMVIADSLLAPIADKVFAPGAACSLSAAWLGTFAFSGQILCDFAGYSTCAIGAAACLGFRLPENFKAPYAAIGFSDFWRRWHISLSSWLRDYLYVSLGGNRHGLARLFANLMVTMLLGGLWHGASWTFVVWGGLHGLYLCLERALRGSPLVKALPTMLQSGAVVSAVTYLLVCVAWVFFRAPDWGTAGQLCRSLFGLQHGPPTVRLNPLETTQVVLAVGSILFLHHRFANASLEELANRVSRPAVCFVLTAIIVSLFMLSGEDRAFIYFQF